MAIQDRTGESYENIIISSLEALGHKKIQAQTVSEWKEQTINTNNKNQLHILAPSKRQKKVAVEGTFIQPDIILLDPHNKNIFSIIYITHWSNKRVSKLKFWRTFDEYAQQLISINNLFLSINIVFESLQIGENPKFCKTCEDLPLDKDRKDKPIQLDGWDAGIGYALIEAFDSASAPLAALEFTVRVISENPPTFPDKEKDVAPFAAVLFVTT